METGLLHFAYLYFKVLQAIAPPDVIRMTVFAREPYLKSVI